MAIEGKVASILNTRELIINKGADDGVTDRMRFEVLEPGVNVVDPDTEDNLGTFTRSKITVEVIQTEPRFSIGRTFETYEQANFAAALSNVLSARYVTRVKTIRSDGNDGNDEFIEGSVSVSVGDPVRQIVGIAS